MRDLQITAMVLLVLIFACAAIPIVIVATHAPAHWRVTPGSVWGQR